jgi:hypothetical protein
MSDAIVRVDSGEEQFAYLVMRFGPQPGWAVVEQSLVTSGSEAIEIATVQLAATGKTHTVRFGPARDDDDEFGGESADEEPSTLWLDKVLERATTFSAGNPPHHPGTIARFPVPAAGYPDAISVPMAIIAEDERRAGLYAPPRLVALHRVTLEPIGVGEYPGFDPEFWPPERLSDWPLPSVRGMPQEQLIATIQRFSATWKRVIDAWFANEPEAFPHLKHDIGAAADARMRIDAPAMDLYARKANPVFANWLAKQVGG